MITLQIPEPAPKTLYEASQLTNGLDIADKNWDLGVYFECEESWEETKDGYARFMLLLGCNIKIIKYNVKWYSLCNIAEFMWENRDIFDPFFNENNREGYRPKDYDHLDPEEDSGFYECYIETFESLMNGNYSDEDYEYLYEHLAAKAKDDEKRGD